MAAGAVASPETSPQQTSNNTYRLLYTSAYVLSVSRGVRCEISSPSGYFDPQDDSAT
jgi:hypothetical protein